MQAESGIVPDDAMTDYAYALAEEGRYDEALAMLDLLQNPNTAKALNYRGYATRKLGRLEEGIGYYLESVALDPEYPQVREYLGEAYLAQGKRELAVEQLEDDRGALRHLVRILCRAGGGARRRRAVSRVADRSCRRLCATRSRSPAGCRWR